MNYNSGSANQRLCLACALCCNGVIFADVKLQPGEDGSALRALGLRLVAGRGGRRLDAGTKLPQPCSALDGCRCRVYENRPNYCRQFECALLKEVNAGRVGIEAALRAVRSARQRAERALWLLRRLGDTDEHLALAKRFRRTGRRLETSGLDRPTAEVFGELTRTMHELTLIVSDDFYPGTAGHEVKTE